MGRQEPVVRASEVSQYAFCARAWWLGRVKGYRSTNVRAMRQGRARHEAHGRAVEGYHFWRRLAVALIVLACVLLIAWLLLSLRG
jgi:hypothetical protein